MTPTYIAILRNKVGYFRHKVGKIPQSHFVALHINENAFKQHSFTDVLQRASVEYFRLGDDETYLSNNCM